MGALAPGDVVANRYEVVRILGRGGMGEVYAAKDRLVGETVALKVLTGAPGDQARQRFSAELRLARRVSHPNVCRIHDFGVDGESLFFTMEHVEGASLDERSKTAGRLTPDECFEVLEQACQGLAAIHRAGVVHRDLKPSNLMLTADGTVKLMDFGIAKSVREGTEGLTGAGDVLGTPRYMSPEQARGETVDARADVYALGAVAYELFTGRPLFEGQTPVELLLKHQTTPPPLAGAEAAGVPAAMIGVLRQALSKKREERQATVEVLAQDLRRARAEGTAPGRGAPTSTMRAETGRGERGLLEPPEPATNGTRAAVSLSTEGAPGARWVAMAGIGVLVVAGLGALAGGLVVWALRGPARTPAETLPVTIPAPPVTTAAATLESALSNPRSPITATLATAEGKRVFRVGESATFVVTSDVAGRFYLLAIGEDRQAACLFPSPGHPDNRIAAGEPRLVGSPAATAPGRDLLVALVARKPLPLCLVPTHTVAEIVESLGPAAVEPEAWQSALLSVEVEP